MKNKNQRNNKPVLRFSPTAWAKLLFCRDMTDNEVGGFGVAQDDDLLLVTDFILVKQKVTPVSVAFEDESVADFFEDQVEAGRRPEQFGRVWLHTHPGNSPEPSMTDEETFARVFGSCDWSVMCIVAQDGNAFARLSFSAGPSGELKIPVCIDYSYEFDAADSGLWAQQYKANVAELQILREQDQSKQPAADQKLETEVFGSGSFSRFPLLSAEDLLCEIDQMHPIERDAFMDELAVRSNFWDEEMGVLYDR